MESVRFAAPSYTVERSRSQALCRTGLRGPGQSFKIKFREGEEHDEEKSAVAAGIRWVVRERKRVQ